MTHAQQIQRRKNLATAVASGKTPEEVARETDLDVATVHRACHIYGVKYPRVPSARGKIYAVLARLLKGAVQADIACELKVSRQYIGQVKQAATAAGILPRNRKGKICD